MLQWLWVAAEKVMNFADFLKGLVLDHWYKVLVVVGSVVLVGSLFFDVKGSITNSQVQLLSAGVLSIGLGEWLFWGKESQLKPPSAYTGPAAIITYSVRKANFRGGFLYLLGIALIILGIGSVLI